MARRSRFARPGGPKRTATDTFDSWEAFVNSASDLSLRGWNQGYYASQKNGFDDEGWSGGSFKNAITLARMGWPEGRENMAKALAIVAPERSAVAARAYDVAGSRPDIMRAIGGDPCNMINDRRTMVAAHPVVRIDIHVAASSWIQPKTITQRGAIILSVVDQLEARGYSTELRIIWQTENDQAYYCLSTVFKRAGDALDIDRAAYALTHPTMLRRLGFAMLEHHANLETALSSGYGRPVRRPMPDADESVITILPIDREDENPDTARRNVEKQFERFMEEN